MKDLDYFRRQFLLTVHENFDLPWRRRKILNYNLFYHPDLEFEHSSNNGIEIFLLGYLFDYEYPEYSNKQILNHLSTTSSFNNFIDHLSKYSGHFVIIYKSNEKLILLNDACAQQEIFYNISYSSFGSQPKLLEKVIPMLPHSSKAASEFYSSSRFNSEKIFIGETTHLENIKHLLPNHFIDTSLKSVIRYFPRVHIKPLSLDQVATEACKMLKGYIKSSANRNNIYMAVTGGYDSRVLFLASLDIDCKYYVVKLSHMDNRHYDIVIPQELTKIFNKQFKIIVESPGNEYENLIQKSSIDFSRNPNKPDSQFQNHILINGNISEIARNYYGYHQNILHEELAILYGYPGDKFVSSQFEKWLITNSLIFKEMGYNVLDLFYWEEKMGNWAAKAKTEISAYGTVAYSPFCSHKLLTLLLSLPRKYRDEHFNKLYDLMIEKYSPEAGRIPVNPSRKKNIKLILRTFKILNIIQKIRLKYKLIIS